MTVARPTRYPQVALTPGGNYAEPGSGVQLGGWATGAIYPSADANWLWRTITDWNRSHDASRLSSTDVLTSTVCRVSVAALDIDLGTGLTADITIGGVYYGNGERIDLTDAPTVYSGGSALVFPAGSTRYVCARPQPPTGGAANASSCAELIVSASNPPAGYVTILRVDTDATDIVAVTEPPSVVTYLEFAVAPDFTAGLVGTTAQLEDFITAPIASFAGAAGSPTVEATAYSGQSAIVATGTGAAVAIAVTHDGARAGINVAHTGSGDGLAVNVSGGSGVGVNVTGNASTTATTIDAGTGQRGLVVTGSASSAYAGQFVNGTTYAVSGTGSTNGGGGLFTGSGLGIGVTAFSGATAGAHAVGSRATNSTGFGIYAATHVTATNAARAGYFYGDDQAAGVEAESLNYHALILTPKTTTPTHSAILAGVQTSYPSNTTNGTLTYASSTGVSGRGHWIHGSALDAAHRGIHSSRGGFVHGFASSVASNADAATYTTLTTATCTNGNAPKEASRTVLIHVQLRVRTSTAAANGIDVRVRDTTAAATVVEYVGSGTGNTAGWPLPGTSTGWDRDLTFKVEYTIPAVGDRTFVLEFKRQTAANTVTAQGSIHITYAY